LIYARAAQASRRAPTVRLPNVWDISWLRCSSRCSATRGRGG
jgi:hypothetical protein